MYKCMYIGVCMHGVCMYIDVCIWMYVYEGIFYLWANTNTDFNANAISVFICGIYYSRWTPILPLRMEKLVSKLLTIREPKK